MTKISRRDFIKLAGISAAAVGLSSCGGQPPPDAQMHHALAQGDMVPTVCRICPSGCGVMVRVVDGRAVKIEGNPRHPLNQGKVCPRAQAARQVLYDPDRIQQPQQQTGKRGESQWQPISWEDAIAQVTERLSGMYGRGQAHTLVFLHNAPPGHTRELIDLFCRAYGTPNAISADGLNAERMAHLLTQGWFDLAAHDWEKTAYALFFGGSFLEDWQPQVHMLRGYSYMRRGRPDRRARIVQIGSRFSVSAAKADEWIPLLPGRHGALALGMAHVIIREQLYDHAFVTDHTEGLDDLTALVLEQYSPRAVAGLTGVPTDTIRRLAREFAGSQPSVAVAGRGLPEGTNALFNHVAIHTLNALAGNLDVPGGVLRPRQPPFTPWSSTIPDTPDRPRIGGAVHTLPKHILDGDPYAPEALFFHEVNPLFEGVDPHLWQQAFQRIPFIVSFSSFMDESTRYADLVLPNHTFLERWVDGTPPGGLGLPTVGVGRPAVEPLYDTRHTGDVLLELARAIGGPVADHLPWTDFEELLYSRAQGLFDAGGSIQAESFDAFWSELVERGVWIGDPYVFGQWEQVLTTPSGRFQFQLGQLIKMLEGHGVGAGVLELPHYAGDEVEYPLHLIPYQVIADAGCRAPNAPILWEMYGLHLKEMWHNWVEIHPETAHRLDIADEDQVWVESPQGRIRLKARIYEGAMPDAVNIPLGGGHTAGGRWASQVGGGNVSELVVPQTAPLADTTAWCGTRVKVYKE
ncbi:MAG: molybdopterin-dependent oxidoreductase [Chloroflexi bacterium]|nr:molybdopterin-dependent oxidoreductase [Chloroflexota bacterium]